MHLTEQVQFNMLPFCTVWHIIIAPNFQMTKVWIFFGHFLKFAYNLIQVPMASIFTHKRSEKMPRMATLFRQPWQYLPPHRMYSKQALKSSFTCRHFLPNRTWLQRARVPVQSAAARGGWWWRISRGISSDFIYIIIDIIGTSIHFFKNIDRKNNHTFFI